MEDFIHERKAFVLFVTLSDILPNLYIVIFESATV